MAEMAGKVVVITGGASGIGEASARLFIEEGARVIIADMQKERGRALATELGDAAIFSPVEVRQEEQVKALIDATAENFGGLDVLVNNAGVGLGVPVDEMDMAEYDRLMDTNLKGMYMGCRYGVPRMKERGGGAIINISSVSAHAVSTNRGDYCVAKAGLGMVTKLFAVRLADHGINVYEVCPGVIASDMTAPVREKYDKLIADGMAPIRRWGEPGDVGKAVVALAHDYFPFTTGEVFNVDGGFNVRKL